MFCFNWLCFDTATLMAGCIGKWQSCSSLQLCVPGYIPCLGSSMNFLSEHRHTGTFKLGGGDFLARKLDAVPKYDDVEIWMQTHSNCIKNKNVHNFDI